MLKRAYGDVREVYGDAPEVFGSSEKVYEDISEVSGKVWNVYEGSRYYFNNKTFRPATPAP